MNLPYVLWVYKIALLALIKLSRLQHTWLFALCAIHLCTFWTGVEVFTKGFTYYQQWQLHWKLSIIRYRFSFAFNFSIFSWGFFMPEAWVWEWEGANISITELSYWKETLLCPNQNIFWNKLTYSENNNSMVHSRFRPTNTLHYQMKGWISKMHWIFIHCVAFLQLRSLGHGTKGKWRNVFANNLQQDREEFC